jgi:DNA-directed RNA polymerase specialized sigma24 family protein
MRFEADRTDVRNVDLASVDSLSQHLSIRQRMAAALRQGEVDVEELAEQMDVKAETLRRTARRYKKQFRLLAGGRLGLAEDRRAP